jgi:hypothetical protein
VAKLVGVELAIFLMAVGIGLPAQPVLAGHTFGGGDCWRGYTPLDCRWNWTAANTIEWMRIIDQMNNSQLTSKDQTAYSNWNSANGPQVFSTFSHTNDSWDYMKIDNSIQAPNGYTWNCVPGACPTAMPADFDWSEVYVTASDLNCGRCNNGAIAISIFAHELGHTLGLDHHYASTQVAVMQQATTLQGPTGVDIGPLPPCSGDQSNLGVRCIYDYGF